MKTSMIVAATLWMVAIGTFGVWMGTGAVEVHGWMWGPIFVIAALLTMHMGWWFGYAYSESEPETQ